ncbi:fimbrial biogenesis chaperone [Silvimonas iriomotensis]|uniref:Fimbrial assembly chaperone n=1 Tax=Silvimonas iriomotensis TaxID=449662 RepID=A0ABQ2PD43_9NEIS|nr:molecular chaperone [Silvimonas iriomotensis]GGP23152.1 fimbrial assembly chaperone [Silvimonas iriomotensis]
MVVRNAWRLAIALMISFTCSLACAGSSVLIWPIDPVIESDARAGALWLENRGADAVTLQIRIFAWNQNGKDDTYAEQSSVIASPPFASIPPGERQLVRLTRVQAPKAGTEEAYRLLIDEIPATPQADSASDAQSAGITFQMRYSVPLFVYGDHLWLKEDPRKKRVTAEQGVPRLTWRAIHEDGKNWLEVSNQGVVHARLTEVSIGVLGQQPYMVDGLLGYVLAGGTMRWPMPQPVAPRAVMRATVNGVGQPGVITSAN